MIDINVEAEEYAKEVNGIYGEELYPNCDETLNEVTIKEFKAGHNSKATQAKVLQAQIDVVQKILKKSEFKNNAVIISCIQFEITDLQQQLKELENGN
jgi:exonuclease VII small subunit